MTSGFFCFFLVSVQKFRKAQSSEGALLSRVSTAPHSRLLVRKNCVFVPFSLPMTL